MRKLDGWRKGWVGWMRDDGDDEEEEDEDEDEISHFHSLHLHSPRIRRFVQGGLQQVVLGHS